MHYPVPVDIDRPLNEDTTDKIRVYRPDYNKNTCLLSWLQYPSSDISIMSDVTSTSGRLHCEFVCILFFQTHRETDRFFDTSGVQLAKTKPRPVSFSSHGVLLPDQV